MHAMMARIDAKLGDLNTRMATQEAKDKKSKGTQVKKKEEKTSTSTAKVELDPRTVGFFDPNYIDGTTGPVTMLPNEKYKIYRDVYVFINRLHDMANTKPYTYNMVKDVIPRCLKNTARIWHSTELTAYERDKLRRSSLNN